MSVRRGRRVRRILAIAGSVAAVAALGISSAAGGADDIVTIAITATPTAGIVDEPVTVHGVGTTFDAGAYYVLDEIGGTDCAPTQALEFSRPKAHVVDVVYPAAGDIDITSQFTPDVAGTHHLCAYMYLAHDSTSARPPRAVSAVDVKVTTKPGTDADGDGRTIKSDRCPSIAADTENGCPVMASPQFSVSGQKLKKGAFKFTVKCNQPCDLSYSGKVGGVKLNEGSGQTTSAAAKTFTIRLTKVNVAKVRKLLAKRSSVSATLTLSAVSTVDAASTDDTPVPFVQRRSFRVTR